MSSPPTSEDFVMIYNSLCCKQFFTIRSLQVNLHNQRVTFQHCLTECQLPLLCIHIHLPPHIWSKVDFGSQLYYCYRLDIFLFKFLCKIWENTKKKRKKIKKKPKKSFFTEAMLAFHFFLEGWIISHTHQLSAVSGRDPVSLKILQSFDTACPA